MGRYYNDCLIHSYDYSDFPEYEYEEQTDDYEVLSRYWDDVIEHAGIKGMKWGQRRYQNEDGSYTEAGMMRRYGHGHLSGPRHFGSSRASYRTGARSSSPSSKRKGLSTGAKVALAAAGLAAAGAAGYGIYRRGRRANDAQSEGWSQAKLAEYQRKNKESKDEFERAYSAWDKSRKTHVSDGYRYTDQGDLNLKRAMEDAKQRNAVDGGKLIDYQSRDPEAAARARREHKVGAAIKDFEAGINDIRRHGIIDDRKPTKDSLQKNFSNAFNTERKGPNFDAVKNKVNSAREDISNRVNSLRRSNGVTNDSLQKNFSNAFNKKESNRTINIGVGSKDINDTLKRNADRYNEAVAKVNERINKMNANRIARGEKPSNFPNSNLQIGPSMQSKPSTTQPKNNVDKPKQTSIDRVKPNVSDFDFDEFDRMMSRGDTTLNLNTGKFTTNDPVDSYTQDLLKRNQKTLNSIRR